MSSIVIKGNTSGQIELAAPDVAGSTTLTLPASTGTIITDTAPKVGSVIQVVQGSTSTEVITSSSTFTDTGLTATITPSSTSSKILVVVHQNGITKAGSTSASVQLLRDATFLGYLGRNMGYTQDASVNYGWGASVSYLDTPATTSAITYKTQFNSRGNVASTKVQDAGSLSTITLMEIAG